jgi:hypothetical protein
MAEPSLARTDQYTAAVERNRDVAKWLLVTFAAVGGTLIAGSQLSDLGTLHDTRLLVACVAAAGALLAVAAAVGGVSRVLLPQAATVARLSKDPDFEGARTLLRSDPSLFRGLAANLDDFLNRYDDAVSSYHAKWKLAEGRPHDSTEYVAALDQEEVMLAYAEALTAIQGLAVWKRVDELFRQARWVVLACAVVVGAGTVVFAYAAHPPEAKTESLAPDSVPAFASPRLVNIAGTAAANRALRAIVGRHCDVARLRALAIGGSGSRPEIVTLPRQGCTPRLLTMTSDLGHLVPRGG